MKNKRFTVIIVVITILLVAPVLYNLVNIYNIDLITAVIGGITTASGVYLGGQSISDASREWRNPSDDDQI